MTELLYNLIWLQPWVVLPITGALQISACPRDNAGHLVFFFFCDGKLLGALDVPVVGFPRHHSDTAAQTVGDICKHAPWWALVGEAACREAPGTSPDPQHGGPRSGSSRFRRQGSGASQRSAAAASDAGKLTEMW